MTAKPKPKFQSQSPSIDIPAATTDVPEVATLGPDTILAERKYLDDGANFWVREKNGVACHNAGVYMAERPASIPGEPGSSPGGNATWPPPETKMWLIRKSRDLFRPAVYNMNKSHQETEKSG